MSKLTISSRGRTTAAYTMVAVLIALPFIIYAGVYRSSYHHETLKVTEKPPRLTIGTDDKQRSQLIYAEGATYVNKDSLLMLKFNSSDIYGQLQVGHKYDCAVAGWRIGLFSKYENIIKCEEVK